MASTSFEPPCLPPKSDRRRPPLLGSMGISRRKSDWKSHADAAAIAQSIQIINDLQDPTIGCLSVC
ncbi:putative peptide chain release factor [Corchorus olitorius]|uniref:Peptide chain release factor n=1 Tax=Corchorus olitorius TaxID=93759 RepID=A0A1R3KKX2_9ROSI|nr:putative peptide chain release factor [Corchorus olitorius]